jgi:hypothetical protein
MFRRSVLFGLVALMLATPAVAQRYQGGPQNRQDHRRGFDASRGNHDNGPRGDRGDNGGRGDWRGDGRRFNDDQNNGRNDDRRSERTWRQQQSDPRPDSRLDPSPPDRSRYQRPQERPREVQLTDILRNLRGQYGGQHLDAQRSGENYVIPWLSRDGRRMTVVVDAATGRVISVR